MKILVLNSGLAISRSIIEAHDGQLWAENNPDYGAKFSVKLPVAGVRCATSAGLRG
jgi:signal transduction histidine kinase